jgi:hypothetical protein
MNNSLARSSRAIPAKQEAVALAEFMAKPFIHSTPCDPDPRRSVISTFTTSQPSR